MGIVFGTIPNPADLPCAFSALSTPGYPENTRYHLASWSGSILNIIGGSTPAIGIAPSSRKTSIWQIFTFPTVRPAHFS